MFWILFGSCSAQRNASFTPQKLFTNKPLRKRFLHKHLHKYCFYTNFAFTQTLPTSAVFTQTLLRDPFWKRFGTDLAIIKRKYFFCTRFWKSLPRIGKSKESGRKSLFGRFWALFWKSSRSILEGIWKKTGRNLEEVWPQQEGQFFLVENFGSVRDRFGRDLEEIWSQISLFGRVWPKLANQRKSEFGTDLEEIWSHISLFGRVWEILAKINKSKEI